MPPSNVIHVGEGFWNIRGSLKIGGILDVKTHASLVRRKGGGYILLDACELDEATRSWIAEETSGDDAIEAVLHLHPFHTLFVRALHEAYPKAKLYGTARHKRLASELSWEAEETDGAALHALFADDLDFSVPRGVDFIPKNENLHFSSVLAFHGASKTLHVDDTLCYAKLPAPLSWWKKEMLAFHPSLAKVLERRAGAVRDFRNWTTELVDRVQSIENLCAALTCVLLRDAGGASIGDRVGDAVRGLERKLAAHERKYG
jgi:hypothetical protein